MYYCNGDFYVVNLQKYCDELGLKPAQIIHFGNMYGRHLDQSETARLHEDGFVTVQVGKDYYVGQTQEIMNKQIDAILVDMSSADDFANIVKNYLGAQVQNTPEAVTPVQKKSEPEEFLKDMDKPDELVCRLTGMLATIALRKSKVVLACHKAITGHENAKWGAILKSLDRLKEKKEFERYFKNLVIIRSFSSGQDLDNQLKTQGVNPDDKDGNLIFTFAPESEKGSLSLETQGEIKEVFVDESKLNPDAYYYPLFEIILITLVKYYRQYDADTIKSKFKDLGLEYDEFNIGDITDDNAFVIFKLLPKTQSYNIQGLPDRYALIEKAVNSAA